MQATIDQSTAESPAERLAELEPLIEDADRDLVTAQSRLAEATAARQADDAAYRRRLGGNAELPSADRQRRRALLDAEHAAHVEVEQCRRALGELHIERDALGNLEQPDRRAITSRLKSARAAHGEAASAVAAARRSVEQAEGDIAAGERADEDVQAARAAAYLTPGEDADAAVEAAVFAADLAARKASGATAALPALRDQLVLAETAVAEAATLVERIEVEVEALDAADARQSAADAMAEVGERIRSIWNDLARADPISAASLRLAIARGELAFDPAAAVASDRFTRPAWLR